MSNTPEEDRLAELERRLQDETLSEAELESVYALYEEAQGDLVDVITAPSIEEKPEDPRTPALRKALAAAKQDELVLRAWRLGAARPDLLDGEMLRALILREAAAEREEAFDLGKPDPKTWCNYVGEHEVVPTDMLRPKSIAQLATWLENLPAGRRVRVAGAGHADSPVAAPDADGVLLSLFDMKDISLDGTAQTGLVPQWLKKPDPHLVRVSAGHRVADLNDALDRAQLGLNNMGAYDRQAIFGAITTGTHGSGATLGPLSDAVRAIDLLCPRNDGAKTVLERVRVEPSNGPTDPAAFAAGPGKKGWKLEQNDDLFRAVVVSFGHMGVAVALTLQVRDRYWLLERRALSRLGDELQNLPNSLNAHRHYEMLFNPYAGTEGDHAVLVTRRWSDGIAAGDTPTRSQPPTLMKLREAGPSKAATCALGSSLGDQRTRLWIAMKTSAGQQLDRSVSHEVLRLGAGDFVSGKSCEIFFPLGQLTPILRRIAALAKGHAANGILHTSPIGVRFIRGSKPWLAPSRGDGTMVAIEVPMLLTSPGADEVIDAIVSVMGAEFGARPHWGQHHKLDRAAIERLYGKPALDKWLAAMRRFDPDGRMDSRYTDRLGLRTPIA